MDRQEIYYIKILPRLEDIIMACLCTRSRLPERRALNRFGSTNWQKYDPFYCLFEEFLVYNAFLVPSSGPPAGILPFYDVEVRRPFFYKTARHETREKLKIPTWDLIIFGNPTNISWYVVQHDDAFFGLESVVLSRCE